MLFPVRALALLGTVPCHATSAADHVPGLGKEGILWAITAEASPKPRPMGSAGPTHKDMCVHSKITHCHAAGPVWIEDRAKHLDQLTSGDRGEILIHGPPVLHIES